MFAPVESLPFGDRPLTERALPAQRARAADRAQAHSGCRSDRARRVRRRAGGLRPRLRAHAGGTRPARLSAGVEQAAAAARDARDRGRRAATSSELERARRDVQARVWRDPPAPPARRPARSCSSSTCPAQRTRVAGYDDTLTAEQVAAMMPIATHAAGSRRGFYLGHTLSGSPAARALQPARGLRQRPQRHDPQRRRARLGQDDARAEARVRGVPAGRPGDRLRPQGRPSLPPARRGGAACRVRDAAPGPGAARHARSAARRAARTCARTRRSRSCAICCPAAPSPPGRRRSSAPSTA